MVQEIHIITNNITVKFEAKSVNKFVFSIKVFRDILLEIFLLE